MSRALPLTSLGALAALLAVTPAFAATGPAHPVRLTLARMFLDASPVVKVLIVGLLVAAIGSFVALARRQRALAKLEGSSARFVTAFREVRSVDEIGQLAGSPQFKGNLLAAMAAAAAWEVEASRKSGLDVAGVERGPLTDRVRQTVEAVRGSLIKRLSAGLPFLASVGSTSLLIGVFGGVYGLTASFIRVANTNVSNLAIVAPGISEALMCLGVSLMAAIVALVVRNHLVGRIGGYAASSEDFAAELTCTISRQLGARA